jgi:DNA-binding HxlR family transcriptional regulator
MQRTGTQPEFGDTNRIVQRDVRCYVSEDVFRRNQILRLMDNRDNNRHVRPDCPVNATIAVIRGKWKAAIIQALTSEGLRYGVLLRRIPEASRKVLTQQSRELQAEKVVSRFVDGKKSERVEYALTPYGKTLIPVLDVLAKWGKIHVKNRCSPGSKRAECISG